MTLSFDEYQVLAQKTDQLPGDTQEALVMALLGLAGEAGTLLGEYKKRMRDGDAYRGFQEQVGEELGDLLWYVANIATKCGLSLSDLANENLKKTRNRWVLPPSERPLYDRDRPSAQQLRRTFCFRFEYRDIDGRKKVSLIDEDGRQVGSPLTDNAHHDDGYRFHDVLHLAHAALLGWSPVLRDLMHLKRSADDGNTNDIEDGGRAQVLEEAIAALAYDYAIRHAELQQVARVDWSLLRTVKRLTAGLEVQDRTEAEWEAVILKAFEVWRLVRNHDGGTVRGDLNARSLDYDPPSGAR